MKSEPEMVRLFCIQEVGTTAFMLMIISLYKGSYRLRVYMLMSAILKDS